MKKIIAAAVATAFVAPAFAADVTVSGDIEYIISSADDASGTSASYHDSDFAIRASEDLGNGMGVTVKLEMEDIAGNTNAGDTELLITGVAGGSLNIGEVTTAAALFDEGASVAEAGGGYADYAAAESGNLNVTYTRAIAEGLTLAITAEIDNSASSASVNTTENLMHTTYAVQYVSGNFSGYAGATSFDTETNETSTVDDASVVGFSYTMGPIYVAYSALENGVADLAGASAGANVAGLSDGTYYDAKTFGVTYDHGNGKLFYEASGLEVAGAADRETNIMGASYKLGSVNLYIQAEDENVGAGDDDNTKIGVEYAF